MADIRRSTDVRALPQRRVFMVTKETAMTIMTDHSIHTEAVQFERELFDRLEQRRLAAERGVEKYGSRLAFAAHLARRGRAGRVVRAA